MRVMMLGLLLMAAGSGLAFAGSETAVNVATNQDQDWPRLARLAGGNLAVVWRDDSRGDADIVLRLLSDSGMPIGTTQRVNVVLADTQAQPDVAPMGTGGFVVVFASRGFDASGYAVAYRRYASNAVPLDGQEVRVNARTAGSQFQPAVAGLTNGSFVVAYAGMNGTDEDVYGRRFSMSGAALDATDIVLNALGGDGVTSGDQGSPAVASLSDGGYVVAYAERSQEQVYGVRFDRNGVSLGVPGEPAANRQFQVYPQAGSVQSEPAVAGLPGGGFVVAFNTETNGLPSSRRVMARVYDSNGVPLSAFGMGGHTNRWQDPRIVPYGSNTFLAVWQVAGAGTDVTNGGWSVFAERYGTSGVPGNAASMVNEVNASDQQRPALVAVPGGYVVAWESDGQDGSGMGVYARRLDGPWVNVGDLDIRRLGRGVVVGFSGQPWEIYRLEGSSNILSGGAWTALLTTNNSAGVFEYADPLSASNLPLRLYRVIRNP